ncbi:acid protease [Coniochaeta ligniaria NRRL 30616]|uniref:Acid protease n=1 Tax=Coniochaeta ligniaria NRRL 30616 TaxID=1408157 RepID=A0A1J7IKH3_9PEZI|nr:acid protease [Coniochaeta ligniaria NRRL 30616]
MRSTYALTVGTLLIGSAAADSPVPGVVQWQIEKRQSAVSPLLQKRADTYEEVITNERMRGGYFATCAIGTPFQNLTLQLDTGSSDIWVPDVTAEACQASRSNPKGCTFGTFDPNKSSSFVDVGKGTFSISYVDGTHSKGDYFADKFEIGGAVVNVTMGLGIDTDIAYGLVGVGYALNEAIVAGTQSASSAYPNLPVTMQREGLINTIAYSLWLNDLDANTGNILFGGIDTAKYKGDLTRIQIYQDDRTGAFTSFLVALTSVEAVSPSGNDTLTSRQFPIPVVLDSGTTLSYLPADLAMQIWKEVGAIYSSELQLAVIPCSMASSAGVFTFGFAGPNGPRISVDMTELVLPLTSGEAPKFTGGPYKGQGACEFGIQNFSSDPFLLGDTFLRSAYVVYDLVNNEVGIAPTDFNSTTSNIVAFPSYGAQMPSATAAPSQSQVTARPSVTTPGYVASAGFSETATASAGGSGGGSSSAGGSQGTGKNAGSRAPPFDFARVVVVGVCMVFVSVGSGAFLLI